MKKCPFCGGMGIVREGTVFSKVECDKCGATTKYCSNRREAVGLWEMRDTDWQMDECDSWSQLEDDATMSPEAYVTKVLHGNVPYQDCKAELMALDIVKRARKLAQEE